MSTNMQGSGRAVACRRSPMPMTRASHRQRWALLEVAAHNRVRPLCDATVLLPRTAPHPTAQLPRHGTGQPREIESPGLGTADSRGSGKGWHRSNKYAGPHQASNLYNLVQLQHQWHRHHTAHAIKIVVRQELQRTPSRPGAWPRFSSLKGTRQAYLSTVVRSGPWLGFSVRGCAPGLRDSALLRSPIELGGRLEHRGLRIAAE